MQLVTLETEENRVTFSTLYHSTYHSFVLASRELTIRYLTRINCRYLQKANVDIKKSRMKVPEKIGNEQINKSFWAAKPTIPAEWGDPVAEAER